MLCFMWVICKNSIPINFFILVQKTCKNIKPENSCKLFIDLRNYIMNQYFSILNAENIVMLDSDLEAVSKDHLFFLFIILLCCSLTWKILEFRLTLLIYKGQHWSRFVFVCFVHKHIQKYVETHTYTPPPYITVRQQNTLSDFFFSFYLLTRIMLCFPESTI